MNSILKINPAYIQTQIINKAAGVIKKGGIILYPTDTIYGLGCDAFNRKSIKWIFDIKHRNPKNPALVLVRDIPMLQELVEDVSSKSKELMRRFWPGPLTMLFNARKGIPPLLISDDGKIGIRMPKNNFCLKLIAVSRVPIVSTSANISGDKTITEIEALKELFAHKVDLFIDAGDTASTIPSTVIDASVDEPVLIREGVIPFLEILSV
ncbi:MAG: L-threonylcarbamoyladenylate synthase [Bacteroidota bacterium]|nr:L-threonylcarbamoyladenylate synthase [Bacteroidota bacterium]